VNESHPPILNYRSSPVEDPAKISWLRRLNRGEDSFLGCSALFFAVLVWAVAIFAFTLGGGFFNCLNISLAGVSTLLSLAGLLESATSKTFPLVSLLLNVIFGISMAIKAFG
jgi:hypothetical protein